MQIPSIDRDWFVVRTKPGCEALAADELRIGGHETYLPRRRIKNFIRRQRLLTDQTRPLLPGYLFLAEGNEFRIIEGPFASFMAVSEGVTASDRVIALVSIFGRLARAEFSAEQLEEVA
jgi:transcription antitermination factor NusG